MTIAELREVFGYEAEIYVAIYTNEDCTKIERFKVENLLYGTSEFANIDAKRIIKVAGKNKITIFPDVSITVFKAWKKYQEKHYNENN